MRVVYDDEMQDTAVKAVREFVRILNPKEVVRYDWGMERVQAELIRRKLNRHLAKYRMEIGNKASHAHGIGNNCKYPIYYHAGNELQQCASVYLNTGLYSEVYMGCANYDGRRIGAVYEINKFRIIQK